MKSTRRTLLATALAALATAGCAPLSQHTIPLGRADLDGTEGLARLIVDSRQPVIIQGFDGEPIAQVRVPSALRAWTYLVPPGNHRLWIMGVPYGIPLIPQSLRCYTITGSFEPGRTYVLSEDIHSRVVLLRTTDMAEPIAVGAMTDNPNVIERRCRWQ